MPRELSLADAVREGVVELRLTGAGAGVTSRCEVQLTFRTNEPLAISIPRGCTFVPTSVGLQTMVCTKATTVQSQGRTASATTVTITTICASPHGLLPPPTDGTATYQVPTTRSPATTILDTVERLSAQLSTIARSIGMPEAMFSEAVAQYTTWWVFGNPGFWNPNLTRDEKACPYCHHPYGPNDFTCRTCGYLPIDFSQATSAPTPMTPPVSQQRAGGASPGGHWQILPPPPGSGVPNGGWIWVDGSGQQWTWPPDKGGTRVSLPPSGSPWPVPSETTKPATAKKPKSGHWVIHDPPPFSRVPNGGVEWVEDEGSEQSEGRPAAVPVPPFSPKSVGDILSPQLGPRGVTKEQVEKFSGAIWDGLDLTVKTMTQASSRPLLDVANGGLAAPAQDHPHTVERTPGTAPPIDGKPQGDGPSGQPTAVTEPEGAEGRRYTVEQMQADRWDQWDGKYDPKGETGFIVGVREDKAQAERDLEKARADRPENWLLGLAYDQLWSDPIRHAADDLKRRNWMIEIYEQAYNHARSQGNDNLVAHARAQIALDEWRDKALEDFEQTFGKWYSELGMAISGDALGNLNKFIAEGVPLTAVRMTSQAKGAATEIVTEAEEALGARPTISVPHKLPHAPRVSAPGQSFLLATDKIVEKAAKIPRIPGVHDVICHGDATGFWLKVRGGGWFKVGPKTIVDAMRRTGYKSGPVRLISCKAGELIEGPAQELADLIGEAVEAPSTTVWVNGKGELFVRSRSGHPGEWIPFLPTLPATPAP
jgi:hypothetical protein